MRVYPALSTFEFLLPLLPSPSIPPQDTGSTTYTPSICWFRHQIYQPNITSTPNKLSSASCFNILCVRAIRLSHAALISALDGLPFNARFGDGPRPL